MLNADVVYNVYFLIRKNVDIFVGTQKWTKCMKTFIEYFSEWIKTYTCIPAKAKIHNKRFHSLFSVFDKLKNV